MKKEDTLLKNRYAWRFPASLIVVLLGVYGALEWKSYPSATFRDTAQEAESLLDEDVPITYHPERLPQPPAAPAMIVLEEDDVPIEETVITVTEPGPDTPVYEASQIEVFEVPEDEVIPIHILEEVPVFPGCEDAKDKLACFNEAIRTHVRRNFRYPEPARDLRLQGPVYVQFTIDKAGQVGNIRLRGPHQVLEDESRRIIQKLPQMVPGKQQGRPVRTTYSLPIRFAIE